VVVAMEIRMLPPSWMNASVFMPKKTRYLKLVESVLVSMRYSIAIRESSTLF